MTAHAGQFRHALSRFASGVTIVTCYDAAGRPRGFTASSFTSLSLDPPLVLVCLARSADCHRAFATADRYAVHILRAEQADLAERFGGRRADKFDGTPFCVGEAGTPVLPGALATLSCAAHAVLPGGDHSILVGRVVDMAVADGAPLLHFDRRLWTLPIDPVGGAMAVAGAGTGAMGWLAGDFAAF